MRRNTIGVLALSLLVLGLSSCSRRTPPLRADYPFQAVSYRDVDITDEFWTPRQETNRAVSIRYVFKKLEETDPYGSDVFKTIEGSAYAIAKHPDSELKGYIDNYIDRIAEELLPSDPKKKWDLPYWDRHLYDLGHFFEAAVAYSAVTGNKKILDTALKLADQMVSIYGPDRRHFAPSHEEVEMGLVRLFRLTGDEKYWKLAKFFIDERGKPAGRRSYGTSGQDHKPVVEQDEAVGHCVRATYLYSALTDTAALTGDATYRSALDKIWTDVVFRKMHVTGGIGAVRFHEQFGPPYELPNVGCWLETCAAIGNGFWNHRMFLLTGDSKYIDILERILYNGFLSGVSLKGDRFYYQNVLKSFGKYPRFEWINVPCCPPNIIRLMASLGGYIYATNDSSLYVNLFIGSSVRTRLSGTEVRLRQNTRYPWEGTVKIVLNLEKPKKFSLYVRVPGWARNEPAAGDLYAYLEPGTEKAMLKVNSKPVDAVTDKGYVRLDREWNRGDEVEVEFPMPVKKIRAHEKVQEDLGYVALERGPVVYAAEAVDNGGSVLNLAVPKDAVFRAENRKDILNGVVVVNGDVLAVVRNTNGTLGRKPHRLTLVPYYAWSNRKMGEMAVWLPTQESKTRVSPIVPPDPIRRASAVGGIVLVPKGYGDQNDNISAVYDGFEPLSSADESQTYFRLRPPAGRPAWIRYDLNKLVSLSTAEVYWVDDRRFARLPESWRILYWDGGQWRPVKNHGPYGVEKDRFNTVTFDPVQTSAIRLEVEPKTIPYKAGGGGPPDAMPIDKDVEWRECGVIEWRIR